MRKFINRLYKDDEVIIPMMVIIGMIILVILAICDHFFFSDHDEKYLIKYKTLDGTVLECEVDGYQTGDNWIEFKIGDKRTRFLNIEAIIEEIKD